MPLQLKVEGLSRLDKAVDRIIAANDVRGRRRNLRTLTRFAKERATERTPGSGYLSSHWIDEVKSSEGRDGYTLVGTVRNTLAKKGVFYKSTDGTIKPKLRTYPSNTQQTYGEVIRILDRGGRPHVITPKRVKFLSWFGRGARQTKTGKFVGGADPVFHPGPVYHPGHKPYRIISGLGADIRRLASATLREDGRNIIRAWNEAR